ncbi:CybS-domain-containing protein [Lineolata rhizophorae]|uniref:Succinate dehydrogenase [ubiquinone] cytochrome b small subunit n=1 Tax=Lineolata rhizophorae TaxID=578093 RepID=A0A6A6NSA7_9PEZI|nr:CybS-domain-containing protein [Lineolata rhizophorae]
MASIIRPSLLAQLRAAPLSRRVFSTRSLPTIGSCSNPSRRPAIRSHGEPASLAARSSILPHSVGFHATPARPILPPLPQRIQGTTNEAQPIVEHSATEGGYHWAFERIIAVTLVPLTVAPFAAGSMHPVIDAALCATIIIHSHIGFDAMITDYLPKKRVPKTRKLFEWGLRAGTLVVAVGLYEFETNDVGLTEAISRIWHA